MRSRRHLGDITNLAEIAVSSTRSRQDLCDNTTEIVSSTRSRQDLCDNTNLAEISVKFLHGLCFAFLFLVCFIRAKLPNAGKKIKTSQIKNINSLNTLHDLKKSCRNTKSFWSLLQTLKKCALPNYFAPVNRVYNINFLQTVQAKLSRIYS